MKIPARGFPAAIASSTVRTIITLIVVFIALFRSFKNLKTVYLSLALYFTEFYATDKE